MEHRAATGSIERIDCRDCLDSPTAQPRENDVSLTHIWTLKKAAAHIETLSTQPNSITDDSFLNLGALRLPLTPSTSDSRKFRHDLSAQTVSDLTSGTPDMDGTNVSLALKHLLEPENPGKRWGWTYRVLQGDKALTVVLDHMGNPVPLDADGWVLWNRTSVDFGNLKRARDGLTVDFRRI
jgi:hypothetical protein